MLSALIGFAAAATVVVLLPGPDTLVVVRNLVRGGRRQGLATVCGVLSGLTVWMLAAVVGLAALLRASQTGYELLKIAGACYLLWLAVESFRSRGTPHVAGEGEPLGRRRALLGSGYGAGLATNLLNPKVGVFFIAFLPGFVPHGADVAATSLLFGAIFIVEVVVYFAVLLTLADRVVGWMTARRTRRWIDRVAGVVFVAFAARLATDS